MEPNECRCPTRPHGSSWARGSMAEKLARDAWERQHGEHPYAKARDELAVALHHADGRVVSGSAVLNMVADSFGLPRESVGPQSAAEAVRSVHERIARRAEEVTP